MLELKLSGRQIVVDESAATLVETSLAEVYEFLADETQAQNIDVVLRHYDDELDSTYGCEIVIDFTTFQVRASAEGASLADVVPAAAQGVYTRLQYMRDQRRAHDVPSDAELLASVDTLELVNEVSEAHALLREKTVPLRPMTEQEALESLELLGHDFYLFQHVTTGDINLIYRRKHGGYGMLKPRIEDIHD